METIDKIIERLGGTVAVAAGLDLTPSTVSSWRQTGSIPLWRRPALIAFAAGIGQPLTEKHIIDGIAAQKTDPKPQRKRKALEQARAA